MSNFSQKQINEAYAKTIDILFNGAVRATPEQITPEVIEKVDKMIREIVNCSKALTELSFKLIFQATVGNNIANTVDKYVENFWVRLFFIYDPAGSALSPVVDVLVKWVQTLNKHRQHKFCVITARSRWRSPIEIALMGI